MMNHSYTSEYRGSQQNNELRNRSSHVKGHNLLQNYLRHHRRCLVNSFWELVASPITNFMTVLVIGIALALPASLSIMLNNVNGLIADWGDYTQLSVFLHLDANEEAASKLQRYLSHEPKISGTQFISREEALAEFDAVSGFGNLLNELPENPLPHVLLVTPKTGLSPLDLQRLKYSLGQQPGVETVQYDLDWIKRLLAIIELGNRLAWFLGVLLALGVVLIVSNTIRLMVQNRQDEIDIIRLIGATNSFICRPFLYTGLWLGLFGAFAASCIIQTGLSLTQPAVAKLSVLYQSSFYLPSLSFEQLLMVLAAGGILGVTGAWFVLRQQLRAL